jgi:hypothetical protein
LTKINQIQPTFNHFFIIEEFPLIMLDIALKMMLLQEAGVPW